MDLLEYAEGGVSVPATSRSLIGGAVDLVYRRVTILNLTQQSPNRINHASQIRRSRKSEDGETPWNQP